MFSTGKQEEAREILEQLTDIELLQVVRCVKFENLQLKKIQQTKKIPFKKIAATLSANYKNSNNKTFEAFLEIFNFSGTMFMFGDMVFTLVISISVVTFAIAASVFAVIYLTLTGISFWGAYLAIENRDRKNNREYELIVLRNECALAYIAKKKSSVVPHVAMTLEESASSEDENEEEHRAKSNKNFFFLTAKDVIGIMAFVASITFYLYYVSTLAINVVFPGSVALSLMIGPLGIGVTLGVSMAVCIYFGVLKYRQIKKNEVLNQWRESLKIEFEENLKLCEKIYTEDKKIEIISVSAVVEAKNSNITQEHHFGSRATLFQSIDSLNSGQGTNTSTVQPDNFESNTNSF